MSAGRRPPRLAMLLLRIGVRGRAAEFIIGDLVEEYEARSRGPERRGARVWFWRQALGTVATRLFRSRSGAGDGSRSAARSAGDRRVGRTAPGRRRGAIVSWLDVKLGLRMLAKYPGLSLVSVVGMALAVAIAAGAFGSIYGWMNAELPLPEGERIVALENHDTRDYGNPDRRILRDFDLWRERLASVSELAAYRDETRNLIAGDGTTELVRVAEMTASGFRIGGVAPVLGRPLLEEDERPGAEPVVVIGYEEWRRRFDGDPALLGRPLRFGSEVHTIVGVMPAGYRFPVSHRFWVPLRLSPTDYAWGAGPAIRVFGRLADGATVEEAQAELTTIGRATAAESPATHEHLRPRVMPYARAFVDVDNPQQAWTFRTLPLAVSLLLVLVAVNVGILVYARTATRLGEIAVRSALGASRRRVVGQLFVEALVLAVAAAAVGLAVAGLALGRTGDWLHRISPDRIPFWWDFGLTPGLVAYVAGLAVLAAVIVGVLPALKATGRRVRDGLQQISARGSRMQLGRLWTALIIGQVAVAVAVLPFAVYAAAQAVQRGAVVPGYPADEVLRAYLSIRRDAPPTADAEAYRAALADRFAERAGALLDRLEEEAGVAGTAFASSFPGGGRYVRIEVEGAGTHDVQIARVAPDLFRVIDVPVLAGRELTEADTRGAGAVIVDRVFADRVLGGGQALGRRFRELRRRPGGEPGELEPGEWAEVVGVVDDFVGPLAFDEARPTAYEPMALAGVTGHTLVVRTRGPAAGFAQRLRDMAAAVDPELQLQEMRTAAEYQGFGTQALRFVAYALVAVTLSVLLLSAAGIYAMLSFTVARRRREIGIRSALGAAPRRLLRGVFARASVQLGAGVLAGLLLAAALDRLAGGGPLSGRGVLLLPAVGALMMSVGLLAAVGPARRGLAVQPTEALREE